MADEAVPPMLHELEAEVMREVRSALNARHPRKLRAYTTVMTIMARLYEKGVLRRELHGKTYHYRPVLSAEQYAHARAAARVSDLVSEYGEVALAHFARQIGELDERRLEELRALAEDEDA